MLTIYDSKGRAYNEDEIAAIIQQDRGRDEYLAYLEAAVRDAGFEVKHDGGCLGDSNFHITPRDGKRAVLLTERDHAELRDVLAALHASSPSCRPTLARLLQALDQ